MTEESRFRGPLNRPHWLSAAEWRDLLALHGNAPTCSGFDGPCGATECLSVDHIQARKREGGNDLSNLQFLCVPCNSKKGIKEDRYWSRQFYWDAVPNGEKWRTAQRRAFDAMVYDPDLSQWFAQPASQIAGRLYLYGMVVAAGKTLVIPATAFAYNFVQNANPWTACRRADRILVLTKEQAIRGQLAASIRDDLVKFKIMPTGPRVAVVDKYDHLRDDGWLRQFDVVVACVQMVWDAKGRTKSDLVEILGQFPLIFIDEPHFAPDQVRKLLDCTPRSVVFGTTGSPIKNGSLLRDYVLLQSFTYQDSDENDGGVKYLHPESSVITVGMESADLLKAGSTVTVVDTEDPDYDGRQLAPAMNVVSRVIRELQLCDMASPMDGLAPHREGEQPDLMYRAHAIIRCENIAMAEMLCNQANAEFENNRATYPKAAAWNATKIFVGNDEIPGEKFDPETHPWMRSYNKLFDEKTISYLCDDKCARILFVVGMAQEGVSNPLSCISGSVDGKTSLTTGVQGLAGRILRAVRYVDSDGVIHVPPRRLDEAKIVVHESHVETRTMIDASIAFILNMDEKLSGLTTISDLMAGRAIDIPDAQVIEDQPFSVDEKLKIAAVAFATQCDWRSDDQAVERVVKQAIDLCQAEGNESKSRRIDEWVRGPLREDPEETWKKVCFDIDLPVVPVVVDERERHQFSDDEAVDYCRRKMPAMKDVLTNPTAELIFFARAVYSDVLNARILPQPLASERAEDIRRRLVQDVTNKLFPYVDKSRHQEMRNAAHGIVGRAVKTVLGVPEKETVGVGTKWDCPQVHAILHRADVKNAIVGWTRDRLIRKGFSPVLAEAFGISYG